MKHQKLTYPPLTPEDILTLRGKPVAKLVKPDNRRERSFAEQDQEWVYLVVPTREKEHYYFKSGHLVGWAMEPL